mgnify:FL=1
MNPSQRKINASLPFFIRCWSFKFKPSFKNILVLNHLDINETLTNKIIMDLILIHRFNFVEIFIVNLNPNDTFFFIYLELTLFLPYRIQSTLLMLSCVTLTLKTNKTVRITFTTKIKGFKISRLNDCDVKVSSHIISLLKSII